MGKERVKNKVLFGYKLKGKKEERGGHSRNVINIKRKALLLRD